MTQAILVADPVPAAPDTPSARVPSSWRGAVAPAPSEGARWTFVEITMMAFNALMLSWLMYTILSFGSLEDQSNPVGTLGIVFGAWALGAVALFMVLSLFMRRRPPVAAADGGAVAA